MPKIVISDTSCLVVLEKINELDLLKNIYSDVLTTPEVKSEFGKPLPGWIKIRSPKNIDFQNKLEDKIDKGEASAIALGAETEDCIVILDDLKARKVAESLHLNFTGTIDILVKAKEMGIIASVKPLLTKLKSVGLRFSNDVERELLNQSGE